LSRFNRKVRCACSHVQEPIGPEKAHFSNRRPTPGDIPPKAQKVVKKIVFPGDRGKNLLYHPDALRIRHLPYRSVWTAEFLFHGQVSIPQNSRFSDPMTLSAILNQKRNRCHSSLPFLLQDGLKLH
jgi:hypothetical protein